MFRSMISLFSAMLFGQTIASGTGKLSPQVLNEDSAGALRRPVLTF